jgi:CRISPR-associated protein (TIGR02710 family)
MGVDPTMDLLGPTEPESAEDFSSNIEKYRRIHQGIESYGEGSRSDQATGFYLKHLLKPAVARARPVSDSPRAPVHLLISLCGFTPTPTILTHELLRPKRMVVIVSRDADDSIDVIDEWVTQPVGPLRPKDFKHHVCDPTDPLGIYKIVKEELELLDSAAGLRPYAIIDITGGRKVMSAAAALAAWQLKLDLSYMEGKFDRQSRHPIPGTDRMLILSDPTTLFGEQEMERALEMFRAGAFESARRRYDEICDTVAVPGRARFMRALSEMYRAWCDLDLSALPVAVKAVRAMLSQVRREVDAEQLTVIERQVDFAQRLTSGDDTAILVCFYVLGLHYHQLGRHDFAALLYYRTIEGCLTRRLTQSHPGLDPDRLDWGLFGDRNGARQRYTAMAEKLGGSATAPPSRLTMMASAILLASQNDEMARGCGLATVDGLRHLQKLARMRNKSVLAHGFQTVAADQTKALHDMAAEALHAYWSRHGDGGDLDDLCGHLRFLRTDR